MPWIGYKRVSKREAQLKNWEKRKREEIKLKKIRKEIFRATRAIYIKLLASILPLIFQENSQSFGEEINIEREIFDALQCATIMGEGFEETL